MVYRGRESMMNFLRIELLWALLFVGELQASVHNDQKNITAECGQSVTLPCRARDNNIPIIVVEWSRADLGKESVLMYRDKQLDPDHQHPSFKNRVDLQDKEMKDGNVSVILKNVTINDAGTYECHVFRRGTNRRKRANLKTPPISIITLRVDPPGQTGEHTEDGGKEDGSVGLVIGLSIVAVVFSAAVVLILIYRKHKQCNQDSHPPPAEPQIEMSESFLNSESPAAEYNDRNHLEANNCHDQSTRVPDVTLTLENELLHPPPQETVGLLPERNIRVQ
ncbi:sodium channel subunit beta-3-like [Oreochromis aureus]|uniref:sodium channel subunit beta-3-like n=1 Tax=Oreochromis aureus TaxID=47969 RepID=UPI0019540E4B|nr:sodium channel subunit beta-3-like [Oreochromis aureus]